VVSLVSRTAYPGPEGREGGIEGGREGVMSFGVTRTAIQEKVGML